jgi:hypothetical protein
MVVREREVSMTRWIAVLVALVGAGGAHDALAQGSLPPQGAAVVTVFPGGATFFTESDTNGEPSFNNYELGAAVGVNFTRYVGVEGEVSGSLGMSQDLQFAGQTSNLKSPNALGYTANLVVNAATRSAVVPYVTGGIGGLSLFDKESLGITDTETFLTGNVGGGVRWFSGRWGLRGDYRFISVRGKDDAPSFFGQDRRYGHRVYGGLLLNAGR